MAEPESEGVAEAVDGGVEVELGALGERIGQLIDTLENSLDPAVAPAVDELLRNFDLLHREALRRVAGLLLHHEMFEHAAADPVVGMIFDMYELHPAAEEGEGQRSPVVVSAPGLARPPGVGAPAPAAPPAAAGSGSMIKLTDLRRFPAVARQPPAGGRAAEAEAPARTAPVSPFASPAATTGPEAVAAPPATAPAAATPPPSAAPPSQTAATEPDAPSLAPDDPDDPDQWTTLFAVDELSPDSLTASADGSVLIGNLGGAVHAVRNRCGASPLPLQFGQIKSGKVVCPWHKRCEYDLATGESTSGRRTIVYPYEIREGRITVALGRGHASGPLQPPGVRAAPM